MNFITDEKNSLNFDIVIPVGPNDKTIIKEQIKYTKKNIIGYRNIYLISYDPSISIDGCITINENIFPFNNETIYKITGNKNRSNWYLQQLLKLYSGIIIKDLLDKYLVIDADTFFLKHTSFIENGKCLYNYEKEYNIRYFDHMKKFDINLKRVDKNKSGVCHHMIFESIYIKELINIIEKKHNDFFYNIFLKNIEDVSHSGASEYEIYFNYMLKNHDDKIKLRKLNNKNIKGPDFNPNDYQLNSEFDYISYHSYARNKK